jgi:hypothetical protein
MKISITSCKTNIARPSIAQDYQRGWEIAQKEYLRQQKQEQRQQNCKSRAGLSCPKHIVLLEFKTCPVTEQLVRPVLVQTNRF